ncbi:hypothetical protein F66182_4637 [Fusarium sp. NRRL 66182]|nr:hypothetical protein F66182_4637 [Fusarium sp. NRRL 66182]
MFVARQRAACVARQLQRTARTYASEAHGHHKAPEVNESFSTGSLLTVGAFFGSILVYQFVPQETGGLSIIDKYTSRAKDWEETNALHTKACEQAGFDRNLFENGGNTHRFVDVAFPEFVFPHSTRLCIPRADDDKEVSLQRFSNQITRAMTSHAPRNHIAGHLANMDYVVEHYRQKHLKEEERKVAKLAQKQE